MDLEIITNNQYRPLLDWFELSDTERADLDYVDDGFESGPRFFRYKNAIYDTREFSSIVPSTAVNPHPMHCRVPEDSALIRFHAIQSDSYFSGVLIRYDTEEWNRVSVAYYVS